MGPIKLGRTLVIPKQEVGYIFDLDDTTYQGLMAFAKPIAVAIKVALPCARIGVIVAGYEVPHAHVHLIPTDSMADFSLREKKTATREEIIRRTRKEEEKSEKKSKQGKT